MVTRLIYILLFLLISSPISAFSQHRPSQHIIQPAGMPITIDGHLNEEAWNRALNLSDFIQYWPDDGGIPGAATEVRLLFDDDYLYIGVICSGITNTPVIQSLRRNITNEFFRSDAIGIVLDPYNGQNNGFFFGINAGNAQIDGILSVSDNATLIDTNWDTRWHSATYTNGSTLYIEIAIPFSSLQFREASQTWGINIFRNDMQRFEFSSWSNMPLPLALYDLRFTREMHWPHPPGNQSAAVALKPYIAGDAIKDYDNRGAVEPQFNVGGDIRYPMRSSINADLTINPDFSTVDVDDHIINLSRFDITLPEKRSFFLENGDIFASFGREEHRPFISRSIGLHQGKQIPILYGAKFSGNLSSGLRFGAMNVQTRNHNTIDAQNYSVFAFQQQVLSRSQLKGLFANRQSDNLFSGTPDYNRLLGAEFTYRPLNSGVSVRAMYHVSITEDRHDDNDFYGIDFNYTSRHWNVGFNTMRVGRNYITDVGFIPRQTHYDASADTTMRQGFIKGAIHAAYRIIPETPGLIAWHETGVYTDHHYDEKQTLTDRISGLWYAFETLRGHQLHAYFDYFEVQLPFETRLPGVEFDPLPAQFYSYYRAGVRFEGDTRRNFYGNYGVETGTFYNGSRFTLEGDVVYRISPRMRLGSVYSLNRVSFPENHGEATFHLVGPQAHISFSNQLFWNTHIQYNTQSDNLNINSRFQWRFQPMSDLFIVYNENSEAHNVTPKNRRITIKITYWF